MKASILIITYNHEPYIAQAIQSALMQETDFEYEIVIGEDFSTDKTRQILSALASANENKIILLASDQNIGMSKNFVRTLGACKGKYVALLEGDDYWSCPLKLQKQVDFLEKHPEYSICFHDAKIIYDNGKTSEYYPKLDKSSFELEELFYSNFIPTCSVVFRNKLFQRLPDWTLSLKMLDWPLHILNAQYGKIGYMQEAMSVYRVHRDGAWSSMVEMKRYEATIALYKGFVTHFNNKHVQILNSLLATQYLDMARLYDNEDNIKKMSISIYKAATIDRQTLCWLLKTRYRTILHFVFSTLRRALKSIG